MWQLFFISLDQKKWIPTTLSGLMLELQSHKKIRTLWLATGLIFLCSNAFAGDRYNSQSGHKDFCVTLQNEAGTIINNKCQDVRVTAGLTDAGDYFTLATGAPVGGATSMTSLDTAVSVAYSYVRKAIASDPAFQNGTLANGTAGQLLTIFITEVQGSGTFTLTPTTKTGITSLVFDAPKDMVSLLYVDNTVGWILLSQTSVTVNIP